MSHRKWDLAWAALDPTLGRVQAGRRPALVYSNDVIACASLSYLRATTVSAAPLLRRIICGAHVLRSR
jgi:mRNA-degrading endonuclease toxin of MazEF toxin-antitoxin module